MEIQKEVDKAQKEDFIEDVKYPECLSNVVIVENKNDNWHICIKFTDLSKSCTKDHYPLPKIDQQVNATIGHDLLSFLDAYSEYNQIKIKLEDQEKTLCITIQGTYFYNVLLFMLKNIRATYHKLVNNFF